MHASIHPSIELFFLVALITVFFFREGSQKEHLKACACKKNNPELAQDGQQNDSKLTKKTRKNQAKMVPKSTENQRKIDPKRSQETPGAALKRQASKKVEKISGTVDFGRPRGRPGDPKFIEKCIKKTMKKRFLPKTMCFRILSAFRASRRRFSSILGPKMDT